MISDEKVIRQIIQRLSLRKPQADALKILATVVVDIGLDKDTDIKQALAKVQAEFPQVTDFERDFPSLCFALATGVGKTRLMGAMCAFLFLSQRSKNFFILAPNTTIYQKLIDDFSTPSSPKYVFKGISQFAQRPPIIVTGDTWQEGKALRGLNLQEGDLFEGEAVINIFNVDKINKDKGKVKKLHEYIGQSYFDYLAELPDLVLMMDEAHRYRAKAGMKAVTELKPVIGLEMTATPKTVGANPQDFKNVILDYGLGNAMADGFVKEPAVATRANFNKSDFNQDQLEEIMLKDAVQNHEHVKGELDTYARANGKPKVHPFILVVAQDTAHASQLLARMESDDFFSGRYKGRVIEVHSNQKGEEKDDAIERLVSLETDNATEIVIHVNKLKEGWDVTNLYTIVPLRASASEILTEQTLGRGLRLPYGERTGNEIVDTLTVIAHDRFDEVIKKAREDNSVVRMKEVILQPIIDADAVPARVIEAPSQLETLITGKTVSVSGAPSPASEPMFVRESDQQVALAVISAINRQASKVKSLGQLNDSNVQADIVRDVERSTIPAQAQLDIGGEKPDSAAITKQVVEAFVKMTIEIPEIAVLPTREVNFGFKDFDLTGLAELKYQPISDEILIRNIRTESQRTLARSIIGPREERSEDYIIRHLISFDEIDYDEHADLLYKLAGQAVAHLESYLDGPDEVENVALGHGRALADFVFQQMKEHYWETPADYQAKVTKGFRALERQVFNATGTNRIRSFKEAVSPLSDTKKYVFNGFQKCANPFQKFDSDDERRLAVLIDSDFEKSVLKWIKPGPKQFQIEYLSGHGYEPDFVIETNEEKLIVEVKARKDLKDETVLAKAKAAKTWVEHANHHASENGGKQWTYLLVPHDEIKESSTLAGLKAAFGS